MRPVRILAIAPAALCVLAAQNFSPDEVRVTSRAYAHQAAGFQVESKLVDVGVVVRDSHGRAVPGLTKRDFHLFDNEKEREISDFNVETFAAPSSETASSLKPVPRFVALYFDDVNQKDEQQANDLKQTQTAAAKFIRDALQPGIQAAIFTASGAVTVDFTTDSSRLLDAIANLRPHMRVSESGVTRCPRVTPYMAYLIAKNRDSAAIGEVQYQSRADLCPATGEQIKAQAEETWRRVTEVSADTLDSIARVVDRLAAQPGTRILVVASSGFLTAAVPEQKDSLSNRALRANVVINALDCKGLYAEHVSGARPFDGTIINLHGPAAAGALQSGKFAATLVSCPNGS